MRAFLIIILLALGSMVSPSQGKPQVERKLTPKQIFQAYNDSVVTVVTNDSSGSGFFVKNGLLVATCYHVIKGATSIEVQGTKGEKWQVGFVYFDKDSDAAILKLADESGRKPIPVGDFSKLATGDDLSIIGNPLGFLDQSLTTGIVSARRNDGKVDLIQTTAAISPGSSGSPVLNSYGQFVGFVSYHFTEGQSLNMAVSSTSITKLWSSEQIPIAAFIGEENTKIPRKAKSASLGIGSTKLSSRGNIQVVFVPKGYFSMGSETKTDEKPVRQVFLDAFWIGKNDVTVEQFRAYCDATGYNYAWDKHKPNWGWIDNHPMVNVSWYEARDFCAWAGGNLPTEAQWEKAARGLIGQEYPWGEVFDTTKLHASKSDNNGVKSTAPVGTYPAGASPYGCLDMAGNVWQWCMDCYGDYEANITMNPTGRLSSQLHVLRGGGWANSKPDNFRSANRQNSIRSARFTYGGFRIAGRF